MELKKTLCTSLITLGMSLPFFAHAASNLTITNDTNQDSTSILNHGLCSTILGSVGVTKAHSTNVVPAEKLSVGCFLNKHNCQADVYMTNNCSGPKIAIAIFDIDSGIKSVQMLDPSYSISGEAFHIVLSDSSLANKT